MKIESTKLAGVLLITPDVFGDERGFFMETYNEQKAIAGGLTEKFVQDNHSRSAKGVLRGLHYQYPQWQGKLVRAIQGEIYDVAVDIREGSETFGEWVGVYLSSENKQQLYVPAGFAHGFCVTSEFADVAYKCTSLYEPKQDAGVLWNDPDIGIDWPVDSPVLSEKDTKAPRLHELSPLSV